eukprot:gene25701-biopygen4521
MLADLLSDLLCSALLCSGLLNPANSGTVGCVNQRCPHQLRRRRCSSSNLMGGRGGGADRLLLMKADPGRALDLCRSSVNPWIL